MDTGQIKFPIPLSDLPYRADPYNNYAYGGYHQNFLASITVKLLYPGINLLFSQIMWAFFAILSHSDPKINVHKI